MAWTGQSIFLLNFRQSTPLERSVRPASRERRQQQLIALSVYCVKLSNSLTGEQHD